jgi:hypothetical protein
MAQTEICLKLRTAQIKITIFQTQIFAGKRLGGGIQLKRERTRVVKDE